MWITQHVAFVYISDQLEVSANLDVVDYLAVKSWTTHK